MSEDHLSDVLTLAQAAELMQCSTEALRKLAMNGNIPARRLGGWRFSRAALLQWLAEGERREPTCQSIGGAASGGRGS
ncbi:MAG: helix-turn-helix domain-containing protein [Candidatus Competibacteraceae bacterium]|nr:helix-turn-helix domain-containing protein [Candidatus Competibacteraceae bacterium]